jgi:hypothetical protein
VKTNTIKLHADSNITCKSHWSLILLIFKYVTITYKVVIKCYNNTSVMMPLITGSGYLDIFKYWLKPGLQEGKSSAMLFQHDGATLHCHHREVRELSEHQFLGKWIERRRLTSGHQNYETKLCARNALARLGTWVKSTTSEEIWSLIIAVFQLKDNVKCDTLIIRGNNCGFSGSNEFTPPPQVATTFLASTAWQSKVSNCCT